MSSVTFSPGSVIGRAYRVVRPLAQGGMGAVYVAEEMASGRACAVKVMHARLMDDPKNRERFAQEAAVGEHIGTEHVVEVYARGIDDATGTPFIAMELLEGETLQARIWRDNRPNLLSPVEVLSVLDQLSAVLEAAHARGLVHRDLKPENIYLTPRPHRDAPFTLKLLDFGVARFVDPSRPVLNATAAIGTPLWMAPEQHTGAEISPAADVWAVGLIAFQLLTGRFYWLAANQKELNIPMLLQELLFDPLPPAAARAAALGCARRIPLTFDAWFTRCVARDPHQRFVNAVMMRAPLAQALSGPTPEVEPLPPILPAQPAAPVAQTVGFGEAPQGLGVEAPTSVFVDEQGASTSVQAPAAHELPTALYSPPAERVTVIPEAVPRRLVPLVIIAAVLVIIAALFAVSMRGRGPAARILRSGRRAASHGQERPVDGSPAPPDAGRAVPRFDASTPIARPGFIPPNRLQSWQGSLRGLHIDGEGFELELRVRRGTARGSIRWMWADGGERREPLEGLWDLEKGELWLNFEGSRRRRINARVLASGDLAGEYFAGGDAAAVTLNATLKTPLVESAPP